MQVLVWANFIRNNILALTSHWPIKSKMNVNELLRKTIAWADRGCLNNYRKDEHLPPRILNKLTLTDRLESAHQQPVRNHIYHSAFPHLLSGLCSLKMGTRTSSQKVEF